MNVARQRDEMRAHQGIWQAQSEEQIVETGCLHALIARRWLRECGCCIMPTRSVTQYGVWGGRGVVMIMWVDAQVQSRSVCMMRREWSQRDAQMRKAESGMGTKDIGENSWFCGWSIEMVLY